MATEKITPKISDKVRVIGTTPVGTVREINGGVAIVVFSHQAKLPSHQGAKAGRKFETIGEHNLETLEVVEAAKAEPTKK